MASVLLLLLREVLDPLVGQHPLLVDLGLLEQQNQQLHRSEDSGVRQQPLPQHQALEHPRRADSALLQLVQLALVDLAERHLPSRQVSVRLAPLLQALALHQPLPLHSADSVLPPPQRPLLLHRALVGLVHLLLQVE